jgi:hypothetical protein
MAASPPATEKDNILMKVLGIVILTGLVVGCGGSDDNGGGSGVPSNKQLSDLTTQEATNLCNAHQADFDAIAIGGCRLATSVIAPDQCSSCDSTGSVDCTGTNTSQVAGCTVTVGAYEDCLSKMADAFGSITCTTSQSMPSLPSCYQDIQTKCPSLLGGGSTSADGGF